MIESANGSRRREWTKKGNTVQQWMLGAVAKLAEVSRFEGRKCLD